MPYISGLSKNLILDKEKRSQRPQPITVVQCYGRMKMLLFTCRTNPQSTHFLRCLAQLRYEELSPKSKVDLVVIGCPQASLEEIRHTAAAVRTHLEFGKVIKENRLWVLTSGYNYELASADGSIDLGTSRSAHSSRYLPRSHTLQPKFVQSSAHKFTKGRALFTSDSIVYQLLSQILRLVFVTLLMNI